MHLMNVMQLRQDYKQQCNDQEGDKRAEFTELSQQQRPNFTLKRGRLRNKRVQFENLIRNLTNDQKRDMRNRFHNYIKQKRQEYNQQISKFLEQWRKNFNQVKSDRLNDDKVIFKNYVAYLKEELKRLQKEQKKQEKEKQKEQKMQEIEKQKEQKKAERREWKRPQ